MWLCKLIVLRDSFVFLVTLHYSLSENSFYFSFRDRTAFYKLVVQYVTSREAGQEVLSHYVLYSTTGLLRCDGMDIGVQ